MAAYNKLDRLEMDAADRLVSVLQRLFRDRRWLRNTLAALAAAAFVAAFPIEAAVDGIARDARDK